MLETNPDWLSTESLPWERTDQSERTSRSPLDALVVDRYTALIAPLQTDPQPNSWAGLLEDYHWRATNVRGWLPRARRDDLVLFLVGPTGTEDDPDWQAAGAQIETDDRICRKLLWLQPGPETDPTPSLDRLVWRTFLARPWKAEGPATAESLDPWQRLERTLTGSDGLVDGDMEALRAWRYWLTALEDDEGHAIVPGGDLVDRLLAVFPRDNPL